MKSKALTKWLEFILWETCMSEPHLRHSIHVKTEKASTYRTFVVLKGYMLELLLDKIDENKQEKVEVNTTRNLHFVT